MMIREKDISVNYIGNYASKYAGRLCGRGQELGLDAGVG